MPNAFSKQIQNRNFLSPLGFKFSLAKEPKVPFFSNSTRIPDINLGIYQQSTPFKTIDVPGEIITYGDFYLRFLVDENMENYMLIHNWITGLGFPENHDQFRDLITNEDGNLDDKRSFSDGTLQILNSNFNPTANIIFKDLFPYNLTSLEFDATEEDVNYFTAEVSFKYTVYNIVDNSGNPL